MHNRNTRMLKWFVLVLVTVVVSARGADSVFFRVLSPTNSRITAFSANGTLTWTNAATSGVTCLVQRAATLTVESSNWVDFVQHAATNVEVSVRLFDDQSPSNMALIPAGCFQIGDSRAVEFGSWVPPEQHTVYVSAFYMGKTAVSKSEWDVVYHWAITNGYAFDNPGSGKAANHPVQTVNWFDCVKWCNARSEMEGLAPAYYMSADRESVYRTGQVDVASGWVLWKAGYRLPTSAEREKAARGGLSGKFFPWGDTIDHSKANYYATPEAIIDTNYYKDVNLISGYHPDYYTGDYDSPYTSPIDAFAPNGYGLHGMAGNVFEWCWDWFCRHYVPEFETDPRGPDSGEWRVSRGGCWAFHAGYALVAYRQDYFLPHTDMANDIVGFRVVLPVEE